MVVCRRPDTTEIIACGGLLFADAKGEVATVQGVQVRCQLGGGGDQLPQHPPNYATRYLSPLY